MRMKIWTCAISCCILASTLFLFSSEVVSDPIFIPVSDGVSSVKWDFNTTSDYSIDGVNLEPGYANLSLFESVWQKKTLLDFTNGTAANLTISGDGNVSLSIIDTIRLLGNGNFTNPDDGSLTANADNWTSTYSGNALVHSELREDTGGLDDGLYAWKNRLFDFGPAGYNATVWLNQTFTLPSVPLSINISAFHNFQNNSFSISPGSTAKVWITKLSTNETEIIYDSGMVNGSYPGYKSIWQNDPGIFNEPGQYNITLFTFTDTRGNNASTCPGGIDNFWDNASIKFNSYESQGYYISDVFDVGSYAFWKNASWNEYLPNGTDLEIFVRTGNSSVPTDSIWSSWSNPLTDPSGAIINRPQSRYLQYKVKFTTQYTNYTPVLNNLNISYEKYHLGGEVETLDFTPTSLVRWGIFSHSEDYHGQTVKYQYTTNAGATWHEIPVDGDLSFIPISETTIRIRALLNTTDSVITPTIHWMRLNYVSSDPAMSLAPVWNSSGAIPGDIIRLYVYFNNTATSSSTTAWLNVYLDDHLEYVANNTQTLPIFDSNIPDSDSGIQKYVFSDIHFSHNVFWIDTRVKQGVRDGEILQTTVTLDYLGPLGNRVESILKTAPIRVDGPMITLDFLTENETADVGDQLNYRLFINNTGRGVAKKIWINGTLDDRLEAQNLSWIVVNITGNSTLLINFTATLKDNVVQASTIPIQLFADYSDNSNYVMETETEIITVTAWLKSEFNLTVASQNTIINSNEMMIITIHFNNTGYGRADAVKFNFTVPYGMEFVSSSERYTQFSGICVWEMFNVGPGAHSFTATLRSLKLGYGNTSNSLIIYMQVTDPVDGLRPVVSSHLGIIGPRIVMTLTILNETADVGDLLNYHLYVNNTGNGIAKQVWINGTLDERLEGQTTSWVLTNVSSNSTRFISFNATFRESVVQGSMISTILYADYSDSSNFMREAETNIATVNARLRSEFSLVVISQSSMINSNEMLVLTIHFNNTGYGHADSVKFNFTIPEGMEFVSASEVCTESPGLCNWEMANVAPGPHSFTITLRALKLENRNSSSQIIIDMLVTDPIEGMKSVVSSLPISVSIIRIYTFQEKIYWPWSGVIISISIFLISFSLWYYFKPVPPSIDDAFIIYRDGRLISHRKSGKSKKSELDGDLVGAMLTAVQEFITDSLSDNKSDRVKKLEFGDRELYLERGAHINLALIYSGAMNKKLQTQIEELISKIETEHPYLASWDGRMTQLAGVNVQLDELIKSWQTDKST